MATVIIVAIISFLQAILTAIIAGIFSLERKNRIKQQAKESKREQIKLDERRHFGHLMQCYMTLSIQTALVVNNEGMTNGLAKAMEEAERASEEYNEFTQSITAAQII